MQQGNRHCTANIRNTRAHNSRGRRIRKRRNRTLQVVGRFLTLFVLTLVLAVGIMLRGAALLGWWPSKEIPRQENSASTPLLTPAQTPEPLTVDVTGINSPYALLMCRDGTELGQESADASIYPASMTKIMTVLLGVENIPDLDAEVTLDPDIFNDLWAENASMAGFAPGETVTVRDILYGSLLPSGAECSVTIAQLVDGGVEAFADRMNNRAAEIGMQHTHFTNPTGLHDPEHVSTVRDIAMLLNTALENPTFREIFTTRSYTTTSTDAHPGGIQLYTLKQMSQAGTLTREYLHHLLTEEKPNQRQKFFLNQEDVQRYFPKHYTPQQMQQVILHLLHTWQHKRGYNKDTQER